MNLKLIELGSEFDQSQSQGDEQSKQFQSVITQIFKDKALEIQFNNTFKKQIQLIQLPKHIKNKIQNAQILHYSHNSVVLSCKQLQKPKEIIKIVNHFELLKNQIRILQKLDSQNISRIVQSFQNGFRTDYYGLNIFQVLKPYNYGFRLSCQLIICILNSIVRVIAQLQVKHIVHGDVKPQNILVTYEIQKNKNELHQISYFIQDNSEILRKLYSNQLNKLMVTLIDFGNSFQLKQNQFKQHNKLKQHQKIKAIKQIPQQKAQKNLLKNIQGPTQTFIYRSPQSIHQRGQKQIDIWGVGHILFQLLSGQKLINDFDEQEQLEQLFQNQEEWQKFIEYRLKQYQFVPSFAFLKHIILRCLKLKKQERVLIQELQKQLKSQIQSCLSKQFND